MIQNQYFPRLSSEINSWINWNWSCHEIVQFIQVSVIPMVELKRE